MGPMIAGVSSLIKNRKLMTFIDKDNNKASVKLDGSETENGGTPVKLKHSKKLMTFLQQYYLIIKQPVPVNLQLYHLKGIKS